MPKPTLAQNNPLLGDVPVIVIQAKPTAQNPPEIINDRA
jgi:hypothetical protein